jgi:hypothetical protein
MFWKISIYYTPHFNIILQKLLFSSVLFKKIAGIWIFSLFFNMFAKGVYIHEKSGVLLYPFAGRTGGKRRMPRHWADHRAG